MTHHARPKSRPDNVSNPLPPSDSTAEADFLRQLDLDNQERHDRQLELVKMLDEMATELPELHKHQQRLRDAEKLVDSRHQQRMIDAGINPHFDFLGPDDPRVSAYHALLAQYDEERETMRGLLGVREDKPDTSGQVVPIGADANSVQQTTPPASKMKRRPGRPRNPDVTERNRRIREFCTAHPSVGPTDVAKRISEQLGTTITADMVRNARRRSKAR